MNFVEIYVFFEWKIRHKWWSSFARQYALSFRPPRAHRQKLRIIVRGSAISDALSFTTKISRPKITMDVKWRSSKEQTLSKRIHSYSSYLFINWILLPCFYYSILSGRSITLTCGEGMVGFFLICAYLAFGRTREMGHVRLVFLVAETALRKAPAGQTRRTGCARQ